jgi:hypothetical protein
MRPISNFSPENGSSVLFRNVAILQNQNLKILLHENIHKVMKTLPCNLTKNEIKI